MARTRGRGRLAADDFPLAVVGSARPKKKSRARGVVLGVFGGLLLLVLLIGGAVFWFVQRTLPTTSGAIILPGLTAPATIVRDGSGIPYITAANIHDLFMAQGFVHAQDRLFQMDFYRRVSAGRLSEVLGPTTLETDKFLRTIGMRRAAAKDYDALPEEYVDYLRSYAAGVNAFLDTHRDRIPLEFTMLSYRPERWSPLDSVAFGKLLAWDLSENMFIELTMADLQARIGPERAAQLLPSYPDGKPTIVKPSALPGNPNGSLRDPLFAGVLGEGAAGPLGSNNWVIDGARSASGTPLIANDPHLSVRNPSIWYAMGLRATDGSYDAAGATFASAPGVIIGHNRDIAWGVTNLGPDTQDLYVEQLGGEDRPNQYFHNGNWQPMEVLNETIRVKGRDDVNINVRITNHGPLLNEVMGDIAQPVALRWTALLTGALVRSVIDVGRASNWDQFRAALSHWDVAGQNFVYADKDGNIGYQASGRWPMRRSGSGLTPVDGSVDDFEWVGFVPFEELPSFLNPPEHYIVTANNRVAGPDYPNPATGWWFPWFRAERIEQMIQAKDKLTVEDFKQMQVDTHSVVAQKFAGMAGRLQSDEPRLREAIGLLRAWDGDVAAMGPAPAIYEVTWRRVATNTLADELGSGLAETYRENMSRAQDQFLYQLLDQPDNAWWQNVTTPGQETRDDILLLSLEQALEELARAQGQEMSAWSWGAAHTITFAHPLGAVEPLDRLLNIGPFPMAGDANTVPQATYDQAEPYLQTTHPSMRFIADAGNWTRTQIILPPGQSGQPFSPYWNNMTEDWLEGRTRPLLWSDEQIAGAGGATLTLNPEPEEEPAPEEEPTPEEE